MGFGPNWPGVSIASAVMVLLAACATPDRGATFPGLALDAESRACGKMFAGLDRRVRESGVRDAGAARVPGMPFLRITRLLDRGLRPDSTIGPVFEAWVDAMIAQDRVARRAEILNLGEESTAGAANLDGGESIRHRIVSCGEYLRAVTLGDPALRGWLLAHAQAPDSYDIWSRAVGLYPLSSAPFSVGIDRAHRDVARRFATPLSRLGVAGRLVRYVPSSKLPRLTAPELASLLAGVGRDALGLPRLTRSQRRRLFAAFAPVLEIDTFGDADRIGAPVWRSPSQPDVDTSSPTVYRRLSFARIAGRIHLQLNYVLWFPERPVTGPLDILGGRLDGITLRITLDEGGRAVMYDAMHNCGCYHMFIPTPRMRRREGAGSYDEPPLIPQPVPVRIGSPVLRIAHRTHYVQRLYDGRRTRPREHFERHSYELSDYDELRSIPTENGRRSLFGPDGIVPGTERRERWLFWPMGVRSPGAMRQWGHHAIAFIGRRHFDDPDWIERFFQLNED